MKRFLIPLFVILLAGIGLVSAVTISYSDAYPANNSKIYTTNEINYTIDYEGHGLFDANTVNYSLISISLDGTTYVNYTTDNNGTAGNNATAYYNVEQSANSGEWIYFRYYLGNDTTYNVTAVTYGIYQYKISRLCSIPMLFAGMVTLIGDILNLIVAIIPIILIIVIIGFLKGWFKNLGSVLDFKKFRK